MTIKNFTVTLDDEVVNEAKELMQDYGGKLSPLVNKFLKDWIKKQKEK